MARGRAGAWPGSGTLPVSRRGTRTRDRRGGTRVKFVGSDILRLHGCEIRRGAWAARPAGRALAGGVTVGPSSRTIALQRQGAVRARESADRPTVFTRVNTRPLPTWPLPC